MDTTQAVKQMSSQIRAYCNQLLKEGYGYTRRELKEKNYIDIQEFLIRKDNTCEMKKEYLAIGKQIPENQYFYHMIPCYDEGVFYLGKDQYLYWQVKTVSMEKNQIQVFLMLHSKIWGAWVPGMSGLLQYTYDPEEKSVLAEELTGMNVPEVFRCIPIKELHWGKTEANNWRDFQTYISAVDPYKGETAQALQGIGQQFLTFCTVFNHMLLQQKPKRNTKKGKTVEHHMNLSETPERKTVYIGKAVVHASQPPRRPCTSITYHVGSWKTRGHIRHYKSGKTVYIKERVCHRRKTETTVPANAKIVVRKEKT